MNDDTIKAALTAIAKMNVSTAERQFALMKLIGQRAPWLSEAEKVELLNGVEADNKKLQVLSAALQKIVE